MRGYTADEVRAAEAPLLAAGVPLMARAAVGLADAVSAELSARGVPVHNARILLLVGAGEGVLPADVTVTFGACKAGLLREPAASLAGRIQLVDIGLGLTAD